MDVLGGSIGLVVALQLIVLGILLILLLFFLYQVKVNTKTIIGEINRLAIKFEELAIKTMYTNKITEPKELTFQCTNKKCQAVISYNEDQCERKIVCPICHKTLELPLKNYKEINSEFQLTTNKFEKIKQKEIIDIIALEADPQKPDILRAQCSNCKKVFRYPKKMSLKTVRCPDCNASFILP